ncbi:MAG: hypothetical protein IJV94_00985 [Bacilli bacterium]|nr:hypothetical protein [Bacilli bacterium]
MNSKLKYLILPLICCFLFSPNKKKYRNELSKYETLPINKSNYNFDGYNDFVDNSIKYYEAFLKYVNYEYFSKIELKKESNYSYNEATLFYLSNNITIYKNEYSLSIQNYNEYKCFELKTSSLFYWYFSSSFLDFRQDSRVYFIKDKYRVCFEKGEVKSIFSYEDKIFYDGILYKIENHSLKKYVDDKKEQELVMIANIYLTEYF